MTAKEMLADALHEEGYDSVTALEEAHKFLQEFLASPEQETTAASAVGPSSQGDAKTTWSLAHTASKPSSTAVST